MFNMAVRPMITVWHPVIDSTSKLPEKDQEVLYQFRCTGSVWHGKYDGEGTFYSRAGFLHWSDVSIWAEVPKISNKDDK